MRLTILALPLLVALTACGIPMKQALDDGTYEVMYHFDPSIEDGALAEKYLPDMAGSYCPSGWRKLSERQVDTPSGSQRVIWHVACI